jgi:hypothetical protein
MDAVKTCTRPSFWRRSLVLLAALVVLAPSPRALADDNETPDSSSAPAPAAAPKPKAAPLQDTSTKRATLEMATYADTDHVTVISPSISASIENVTQGASIRGSYLVDVVSAASVDIVSTATPRWHEVRNAGTLEAEYKPHEFGVSIGGSGSVEPDYVSYGAGIAVSQDLNEKNTTLLFGYGYSHDIAGRHQTPFSVFARPLDRNTLNAGITQVVDRATVASVALDTIFEDGDQSKPYRYIPMFAPNVASQVPLGASIAWVTANRLPERPLEQLPLSRQRFALTGRLGHRFESSTLRLEERIYDDSWQLLASTSDAKWLFDLGRRFVLWPHARFHVQSAVNFWERAYVSDTSGTSFNLPEFRTGDRELGPLRTVTGGAGLRWFFGSNADPQAWSLSVVGDVMHTSFLNDIYLTGMTGVITSLTVEGEL